jgi:hypothetical protein
MGDLVKERRQEGIGIEIVVDRDPVDALAADGRAVVAEFRPPRTHRADLDRHAEMAAMEQFLTVAERAFRQVWPQRRDRLPWFHHGHGLRRPLHRRHAIHTCRDCVMAACPHEQPA